MELFDLFILLTADCIEIVSFTVNFTEILAYSSNLQISNFMVPSDVRPPIFIKKKVA